MGALRRLARATGMQALAGVAVWVIVAIVAWRTDTESLDLAAVLLLFAQLVIVPMALLVIGSPGRPALADGLFRLGRAGMRVGAVAALAALAVPRGELSAAIAALYLVPALLVGASVVIDVRSGWPWRSIAGSSLAAGALLFVLHRQDVAFVALPELEMRVAAIHLHFVGLGLVALAGAVSRRGLRAGGVAATALGVGTGVSVFRAAIEPWAAAVGGTLVLAGVLILGAFTLVALGDERLPAAGRRLLFVSAALSVYVAAAAAIGAIVAAFGGASVDLGSAVRIHGTFGAIGVGFCGLLGWRLVAVSEG